MEMYHKAAGDVLREFDTSRSGLSATEVSKREKEYGLNIITVKTRPLWQIILAPFASVFMIVLFVAAAISFWENAYIDGIIILVVIAASAVMDYAQQYSTSRILRSLSKKQPQIVTAVREGRETQIDSTAIVPGEIILLKEGDKVPADARLIESMNLKVNESQLTGESVPISKDPLPLDGRRELYEQSNMLFQGTFVVGGSGSAVVTATGDRTEFGHMAALSTENLRKSPVEQKIDAVISRIILGVGILTVVVFALLMARGTALMEAVRFTIAIAVSAVPEGLPVSISVVLAVGMRQLAKRHALVRGNAAMQSIGVITTIATDKTGTLTKNQLTVQELWAPGGDMAPLKKTMSAAALPSNDPLDQALIAFSSKRGAAHIGKPAAIFEFEHAFALSGAEYHHGEQYHLYMKGSPESILHRSRLSSAEHEKITAELHHLAGLGYRVLAFAHAERTEHLASLDALPKKAFLTFDGFVAIADALRTEAPRAIARAQAAGISVRMITGDHFETAFHIGKKLGLVDSREQVFDSRDMARLTDSQLEDVISHTYVFSRVTPEHKHRLLSLLKNREITAMTGDGVNDVPALTNAHVGIAMGSGSDIAKDAGDIILLDDNFRTIVDAVAIGRTIYANIRRMVTFMLATNIGEVLVSVLALLTGTPLPLLPLQILWINLVTDTTTVIPLGMEPEHSNIMKSPPAAADAPLLSRFVAGQILVVALSITLVTFGLFQYALVSHGTTYAQTMAFWTIAASQWGIVLSMRATLSPIWHIIRTKNTAFYVGVAISIALQFVAMFTPLSQYLHLVPVQAQDLFFATVISIFVPLVILESYKYVGRALHAKV